MRINRIYQNQALALNQTIALSDEASNHVGRVLRMQINDLLVIFNGDGHDYNARITAISKKTATVVILDKTRLNTESPLSIHLLQGIVRGEKMDFIIQKAVELGVSEITPVFTEYSNVKLQSDRLDKKQEHWQKIAISACEQCNRALVPLVHPPLHFKEWVKQPNDDLKLILHPYKNQSLNSLSSQQHITLFVGPEGGFSDNEVYLAQNNGFIAIGLGPRILRTETAPIAALSVLQANWGDLTSVHDNISTHQ